MKNLAEKKKQLEKPRDALIGSYFGVGIWIMTPLLQFYLSHRVEIQKIHEVVQYDRARPFQWFGEKVTEHRKLGDQDVNKATLADVYKLLRNSAYGKCIMNLKRHTDTFYVDAQEMADVHNNPYHSRTEVIGADCFEVCMRKEKINFNLPMIIGLNVYAWAKLRVLESLYDVLFEFVDKSDYMFLESDTDSIYLALAGDTLEELVPVHKRAAFESVRREWFVLDASQKRTPGLLKVEKTGSAFIGLCSKCYVVVGDRDSEAKAKGVQLRRNKTLLSFDNFYKILFDLPGAQTEAYNIGIRPLNGDVCTYVQEKYGLTPLYVKRECMPDGSTRPLAI